MPDDDRNEQVVLALTAAQSTLYAYILSLLADREAAGEVLQETNLAIWREAGRFMPGTDFTAWACTMAYYQVLTWRRKQSRQRLCFDAELMARLADRMENKVPAQDARRQALRRCMAKLSPSQRQLLERRYAGSDAVEVIARELGRPIKTVYQSLYRLRVALLDCVNKTLGAEQA
jgi:RNA polymerase sigma-70 factor (ECF subfamily)